MTDTTDYLVRRLRLRHLELLAALDDTGTLRGTASRLNLSQPAISKMLNEIEAGFGVRLFDRGPRGVQGNPFGHAAVRRARSILNEVALARADIDAMRAGASAVLRLGAPSVTSAVPAAIVRLRRQMPAIAVQIVEGRVRELIERLLDGEIDCVFGAMTPELLASDLPKYLSSEVLIADELAVLVSAGNRLVRKRHLGWGDLHAARWVAPPKETLVRQAFMTAFLNAGADPPEPVIEAMSSVTVGTVLRMEPSLLCAVRLEHAREEVARGAVRRLAVAPVMPLPSLGLFTRRGRDPQPPVIRAFAEALRNSQRQVTTP